MCIINGPLTPIICILYRIFSCYENFISSKENLLHKKATISVMRSVSNVERKREVYLQTEHMNEIYLMGTER